MKKLAKHHKDRINKIHVRYFTQDCFFKKKGKIKKNRKSCGLKTVFISQFKGTNCENK